VGYNWVFENYDEADLLQLFIQHKNSLSIPEEKEKFLQKIKAASPGLTCEEILIHLIKLAEDYPEFLKIIEEHKNYESSKQK
jgi:hypothetical protein